MKKIFLTFLLSLLSFSDFASEIECLDYSKKTGVISNVEREYEDSEVLEISLIVKYGNCESGSFETEKVTRKKQISRIYKDGWNIPFVKSIVEVETVPLGEGHEHRLIISIDKNRAYKRRKIRNFGVHFRYNWARNKFVWGLTTKLKENGKVEFKFLNYRAPKGYTI